MNRDMLTRLDAINPIHRLGKKVEREHERTPAEAEAMRKAVENYSFRWDNHDLHCVHLPGGAVEVRHVPESSCRQVKPKSDPNALGMWHVFDPDNPPRLDGALMMGWEVFFDGIARRARYRLSSIEPQPVAEPAEDWWTPPSLYNVREA
jgi:hypothetical protein